MIIESHSFFIFVKKIIQHQNIYLIYLFTNESIMSNLKIKDCVVLKNFKCSLQLLIS